MPIFTSATDADGVATITWDLPGRSMNLLTEKGIADLDAAFDAALADPAVKGIVLTSAKADFAGGMDLAYLAGMREAAGADPARGLFDAVMAMHRLLRKIERAGMDPKTLRGGKPVAWASPGLSAGIGTEIGLACHRRFLADTPGARVGLPEILVGLFPGAGGTTRLARMLGPLAAAPILLEGKMLKPKAAQSAGLIDAVTAPDDLLPAARAWVLAASPADIVKPWDARGFKYPGGAPYSPQGFMTFVGASAMVQARTQGVYPAAKAMLSAIYEGALTDFETALRIEARHFTGLLLDPSPAAMIRTLFLDKQALEKGAHRPDLPAAPTRRLGVLGVGMMGAGIAHSALAAGIEVILLDRDQPASDAGRARVETLLAEGVKRRALTPEASAGTLARLTATADYAALAGCDLVIEAVFEDPSVKAEALARARAALAPGTILATNTSTLPVTSLAGDDPASFIGIHFFSPVHRMRLVEIIAGAETSPTAIAKAFDLVRQLRKTPILVNDARFFYANRCVLAYLDEGLRLLAEGTAPALIENAARHLGMPVGPLQLADETSIELGVKIAKATRAALGTPATEADAVLFALADLGRMGRKAGAGFYAYDPGGKRAGLWPGLATLWPLRSDQPTRAEVEERLMFSQTLEAVRAYSQGILTDPREGDVAAILGWGFPPWSGGPFSWLDRIGAPAALARAEALAARHGPRFAPPAMLRALARDGAAFRPRPQAPEAA